MFLRPGIPYEINFTGSAIIQANSSAIQHALNYEERE